MKKYNASSDGEKGLGGPQPELRFAQPSKKVKPPPEAQPVTYQWNWIGILLCGYYIAAAIYYFIIRATRTLNIGYTGYGNLVLAVEVISSTATIGYAILLIKQSTPKPSLGLPLADPNEELDPDHLLFNLRVLIPCYKEKVDILRDTVMGALNAALPIGTQRTIYLCDDLPDPEKEEMMRQLNLQYGNCVYVTRKLRKHEKEAKERAEAAEAAAAAATRANNPGAERDSAADTGCFPWWADKETIVKQKAQGKEINGKSNNLNNCLRKVIYSDFVDTYKARTAGNTGSGSLIPKNEVMVVLDADMVAEHDFFVRILEVMSDDDIALCLTPQAFHNVNAQTDIFNNLNLSFWEYMLPGTDAYRYVACTGTNFCLRVHPLAECGWFPDYSITEDYTLGMELKAKGFKARYLNEYLVKGEAPTDPRGVFKQRSRWCKGQIQILFDKQHTPLFDTGLTLGMRLLYTSVTWSYITNTVAVPCSVLVPFIALFFGVYPLVLNRDFALAATLYFTSSSLVTSYCRDRKHAKPMWFCVVSCHILWFTFTKAIFNVLKKKITGGVTSFKATDKKVVNKNQAQQQDQAEADAEKLPWHRMKNLGDMEGTLDGWVLFASFTLSFITAIVGVFQMIDKPYTAQGEVRWFLALSIFWALYNMIPPSLFIFYLFKSDGIFEDFCSFCFVTSFLLGIGGIICTWLVPDDYNMGQVLNVSMQFFEAQRSGRLPRISNVPWRGNSAIFDSVLLSGNRNVSLIGGWYDDGGMLKLTYSTAFTVSLLSWAFMQFKDGYKASGNLDFGANTVRWGADYLVKSAITESSASNNVLQLVAQVGNLTRDRNYWGRPERANFPRPVVSLTSTRPGTDVVAMTSAALAAASIAIREESSQTSDVYLARSIALYRLALSWPKQTYNRFVETSSLYPSASMYDDMAYAAAWLYEATGDAGYLREAESHYERSRTTERFTNPNPDRFSYENVLPALHLMLYKATGDTAYKASVQEFVNNWLTSTSTPADEEAVGIFYTPKGLAKAQPGGTLQHTANAAFLVMAAADSGAWRSNQFMRQACWVRNQIGYMLGDAGKSYVTGYGAIQPRKTPHRAASCPPEDVTDCTFESAYFTTDPNYHQLPGGLVGGPDDSDQWSDDRDQLNPAVTVSLVNNAGFSAAVAGLVRYDINMAKCQQGNGFIQTLMLKAQGRRETDGARWWEGA